MISIGFSTIKFNDQGKTGKSTMPIERACEEAFEERTSNTSTLDRSRSHLNVYHVPHPTDPGADGVFDPETGKPSYKGRDVAAWAVRMKASARVRYTQRDGTVIDKPVAKNVVPLVGTTLTPSAEGTEDWDDATWKRFLEDLIEAWSEWRGREPDCWAIHFDEYKGLPHVHIFDRPVTESGRYSTRTIYYGNARGERLHRMQVDVRLAMYKRGWDVLQPDQSKWLAVHGRDRERYETKEEIARDDRSAAIREHQLDGMRQAGDSVRAFMAEHGVRPESGLTANQYKAQITYVKDVKAADDKAKASLREAEARRDAAAREAERLERTCEEAREEARRIREGYDTEAVDEAGASVTVRMPGLSELRRDYAEVTRGLESGRRRADALEREVRDKERRAAEAEEAVRVATEEPRLLVAETLGEAIQIARAEAADVAEERARERADELMRVSSLDAEIAERQRALDGVRGQTSEAEDRLAEVTCELRRTSRDADARRQQLQELQAGIDEAKRFMGEATRRGQEERRLAEQLADARDDASERLDGLRASVDKLADRVSGARAAGAGTDTVDAVEVARAGADAMLEALREDWKGVPELYVDDYLRKHPEPSPRGFDTDVAVHERWQRGLDQARKRGEDELDTLTYWGKSSEGYLDRDKVARGAVASVLGGDTRDDAEQALARAEEGADELAASKAKLQDIIDRQRRQAEEDERYIVDGISFKQL